jgi:hypothetical protein
MLRALRRQLRHAWYNATIRSGTAGIVLRDLDPQLIRYVQFPELWTEAGSGARRLAAERRGGDWDLVDAEAEFVWSGRYESRGTPSRMIPLERFGFYEACRARYEGGADWSSTAWYRWLGARIDAGERTRRYETLAALEERVAFLDRLYAGMAKDGYASAQARSEARRPWGALFERPPALDEPVVNIGRENRIAMEDGRHRLCLARIARVPLVRVRVGTLHADLGA